MNKNLLGTLFIVTILLLSSPVLKAQKKINVTDFSVTAKEQKVIIDWKTDGTSEINYFAIQKSTDGVNFKTVALVMGPDPKQKNCDCYGCSDKYVKNTKRSYYRVIHVDNAGNEQITEAKLLATP